MTRRQVVDHLPLLEQQAPRILAIAYLGIAACTIAGAAVAVAVLDVVLHYNTPHAPKGAPPA